MKKLMTLAALCVMLWSQAQNTAFNGRDDLRYQIGVNTQKGGTGIMTSLDYGLGDSFSIGAQVGYLLGVKEVDNQKPSFGKRFDLKARFNANIGHVIGLPENVDVYPGLNLGLKNFGGHVGTKIFFGQGFGVFAEAQFPISRYNSNSEKMFRKINNQFMMNFGASFDISRW